MYFSLCSVDRLDTQFKETRQILEFLSFLSAPVLVLPKYVHIIVHIIVCYNYYNYTVCTYCVSPLLRMHKFLQDFTIFVKIRNQILVEQQKLYGLYL